MKQNNDVSQSIWEWCSICLTMISAWESVTATIVLKEKITRFEGEDDENNEIKTFAFCTLKQYITEERAVYLFTI